MSDELDLAFGKSRFRKQVSLEQRRRVLIKFWAVFGFLIAMMWLPTIMEWMK